MTRIAYTNASFGTKSRTPFVPFEHNGTIVVRPSDRSLLVMKCRNRVDVEGRFLGVGAVSYPEDLDLRDGERMPTPIFRLVSQEVPAVKSGNFTWKSVLLESGERVEVRATGEGRQFSDQEGNLYEANEVDHWYYNSAEFEKAAALDNEGRPHGLPSGYFDWCMECHDQVGHLKGRVIDTALPVGLDMARATDNVYFSSLPVGDAPSFPEIYIRTREILPVIRGAVESKLVEFANSELHLIEAAFSPVRGVITNITIGKDVCITLNLLEASGVEKTSEGTKVKYVVSDRVRTFKYANDNRTVNVLVDAYDYQPGDVLLDDSHILNPFQPLVRLVPSEIPYGSANNIAEIVGDRAFEELFAAVKNQLNSNFNGVPMLALSIIEELPAIIKAEDFFMRNRATAAVFDCNPRSLVFNPNRHVRVNLLHHPWFRDTELDLGHNRRRKARSGGLHINETVQLAEAALKGGI